MLDSGPPSAEAWLQPFLLSSALLGLEGSGSLGLGFSHLQLSIVEASGSSGPQAAGLAAGRKEGELPLHLQTSPN